MDLPMEVHPMPEPPKPVAPPTLPMHRPTGLRMEQLEHLEAAEQSHAHEPSERRGPPPPPEWACKTVAGALAPPHPILPGVSRPGATPRAITGAVRSDAEGPNGIAVGPPRTPHDAQDGTLDLSGAKSIAWICH